VTGWKGFAKEWAGFRLDGFVVLARLERWLLSLTAWMDRPGPSEDTIAMQPDLPDVTR